MRRSQLSIVGERERYGGKERKRLHIRHSMFRNKLDGKSRTCIFLGYGEDGEAGYHMRWRPWFQKIVHVVVV